MDTVIAIMMSYPVALPACIQEDGGHGVSPMVSIPSGGAQMGAILGLRWGSAGVGPVGYPGSGSGSAPSTPRAKPCIHARARVRAEIRPLEPPSGRPSPYTPVWGLSLWHYPIWAILGSRGV